jgi:RecB family exonuclease
MTDGRVRFDTDVPGIWGLWPSTPDLWSYSSLKEIEACPRRWMLSHADYPAFWERRGYPSLPIAAAVFGNVVHGVIERLASEFGRAKVTTPTAADVVRLLRSFGGWRGIVLASIDECVKPFELNPRVSTERISRLRDELVRRAPEAADYVKSLLGRGALPVARRRDGHGPAAPKRRHPAEAGAHAELVLTAEDLRLSGKIDLLEVDDADVRVTDFKTGANDEGHDDQVLLYALLWDLDWERNPGRRRVTQLKVAYPAYQRGVKAPTDEELRKLEAVTAARVAAADEIAQSHPPAANPSESTCHFCQVKHLCDAYWPAIPPAVSTALPEQWFDFEGRVTSQNGSRSWQFESLGSSPVEVLVRTASTTVSLPVGRRVRMLDVRRSQDPDDDQRLVISMASTSEWYALST